MTLLEELSRPIELPEWTSLLVASLAAAFAIAGPSLALVATHPLSLAGGVLVGAVIGMVLHELAHRRAAWSRGCSARFVLTPLGLMLTVISGFIPWIAIITPGYVAVVCPIMGPGTYVIAAAGVVVNIALAAASLVAFYLAPAGLAAFLAGFYAVNAWIAFFNLLPVPPLDGYKLAREKPGLWAALFIASLLLTLLIW